MKRKPKIEVEFTLECEPEDTPVRGNAMASGDPKVDREAEDWIFSQLNAGNEWAWCSVKVTARVSFNGQTFEGVDYLGCCSYKSEEDFKTPGGYFEDMKHAALEDLRRGLKGEIKRGTLAQCLLKVLG